MTSPFKTVANNARSSLMTEPGVVDKIYEKTIEEIHEDPANPRYQDNEGYSSESLKEFANDIKERGLINPIVVRPHPEIPGHFQIVSGHRRYRASKIAGLTKVPVRISRKENTREDQIAENLHREDLSVREMLGIINSYVQEGMTTYAIAEKLHKSQSYVAGFVRLKSAPECVIKLLDAKLIKTSKDGAELARAYNDNPDYTSEWCNTWLQMNQEVSGSQIKELRNNIKIEKEEGARLRRREMELASLQTAVEDGEPLPSLKTQEKPDRILRRDIEIQVTYQGIKGTIWLDRRAPAGNLWFIPEGESNDKALRVICSDVRIESIVEAKKSKKKSKFNH